MRPSKGSDSYNPFASDAPAAQPASQKREPEAQARRPEPPSSRDSSRMSTGARPAAAAAPASPQRGGGSDEGDERFTVLVEQYRQLKQKNAALVTAQSAKAAELEALIQRNAMLEQELKKATEGSDAMHEKLVRQVKALQLQIREEKEKASQNSSWFGGGQAAKDLERCKAALVTCRQELRRMIGDNEELHKKAALQMEQNDKACQLLKDKIHSLQQELRQHEELQDNERRVAASERMELQAQVEDARHATLEQEQLKLAALQHVERLQEQLLQAADKMKKADARLEKLLSERVLFDDSANEQLDRFNAVTKPPPKEAWTAQELESWWESAKQLLAAVESRVRRMEDIWSKGDEDVQTRSALRALCAWASSATQPVEGKDAASGDSTLQKVDWSARLRKMEGRMRRLSLPLVGLQLRGQAPGLHACWLDVCRGVGGLARAVAAVQNGTHVHPESRVRLQSVLEARLDAVKESLKEARRRWALAEGNNNRLEKSLDNAISTLTAVALLLRGKRAAERESSANVRGRRREGAWAQPFSYAQNAAQTVTFVAAVEAQLRSTEPGISYSEALTKRRQATELESQLQQAQHREAALQEQLLRAKSEATRLSVELGGLQDTTRQQRAAIAKMAQQLQRAEDTKKAAASAPPPPPPPPQPLPPTVQHAPLDSGDSTSASEPASSEAPPDSASSAALAAAMTPQQQQPLPPPPPAYTPPSSASGPFLASAATPWVIAEPPIEGAGQEEGSEAVWATAERRRVAQAVEAAEKQARLWHQRYVELAAAATKDKEQREQMQRELQERRTEQDKWKEEKEMLHKGYQEQLMLLNDHLLKQGELIAQKDNDLSVLQAHRVKCTVCGGWNTVGWLSANGNGRQCKYGAHPSGLNYAK